MKNYYKILEVNRGSTSGEIKNKFRELALEYHPDVSKYPWANEIFMEINEAYQVLSNEKEREKYNLLYDKYIAKSAYNINNEQEIRDNINEVIRRAQEKAGNDSKVKYAEYIKTQNCFFNAKYKADGRPYHFYVHKTTGISGGIGPTGSIKAKVVNIPVPRCKKAEKLHKTGLIIKGTFLIISIVLLYQNFWGNDSIMLKTGILLSVLLIGGLVTHTTYYLNKTKSKFYYAKKYFLVQKYLKNGYAVGFHPFISTTPFGLIYYLFKILL